MLSEKSYVMGLEVLIEKYQNPLRAKKIITKSQATDIFDQVNYLPFSHPPPPTKPLAHCGCHMNIIDTKYPCI